MSIQTTQQSVIDNLTKLSNQGPDDIKNLASAKLEAWERRAISANELLQTVKNIESLLLEHLNNEDLNESQEESLYINFKALRQAANSFKRITGVVSEPLGMESKSVKLKDVLAKIDEKEMAKHPAYRENLSEGVAKHALKLGSVPVGSFVIIESKDEFRVLVKEDRDKVTAHTLSEGEEGGFTIKSSVPKVVNLRSDSTGAPVK